MRRNHPFDRSIVAVCLVKISSFAEVAIIIWRRFWRWANKGKYVLVKMDWSKRVLRKSSEHLIFYLIPPSLHLLTESLEISHRYSQSYKIFCPPERKRKKNLKLSFILGGKIHESHDCVYLSTVVTAVFMGKDESLMKSEISGKPFAATHVTMDKLNKL